MTDPVNLAGSVLLTKTMTTEAFSLILMGATGDLARIKIWPSIYRLIEAKLVPQEIQIVANGRTDQTQEEFREYVEKVWQDFFGDKFDQGLADHILKNCHYLQGDLADKGLYAALQTKLDELAEGKTGCKNRIFHLAILPQLYQSVVEHIGQSGLSQSDCGWVRILVEKPFGENLETAKQLDNCLKKYLSEDQIYRIDHYLAKETVQNISAFRFANEMFEPQLNKQFIDHIQISFLEEFGIRDRGKFYDRTGAIRDVVQNHLLQLLAVVTMDDPSSESSKNYRISRQKLLSSLKDYTLRSVSKNVVVGQYQGYQSEKDIAAGSKTETFFAMKTEIDNQRWQGVPIYLRTGKKLCRTVTDIMVVFKDSFRKPSSNVLNFRISPDESIILRFYVKKPGPTNELEPANLQFHYKHLKTDLMKAYERVLLDAYTGKQLLFTTADEVEAEWKFVDPIIEYLDRNEIMPDIYQDNSWGPAAADKLIQADGREWLMPSVDLEEF